MIRGWLYDAAAAAAAATDDDGEEEHKKEGITFLQTVDSCLPVSMT
jgi:hypothetical protein